MRPSLSFAKAGLLVLLLSVRLTLAAQVVEVSKNRFPGWRFGQFPDSLFSPAFEERWKDHDFVHVFKDSRADVEYGTNGFQVVIRRFERGKFLSEKGFPNGVFRLSYYHSRDFERIDSIQVVVQTRSGRREVLEPDRIQTIELSESARLIQFAVPLAEAGAVFDVSYRMRRLYLDELPEFTLQEPHPVLHARSAVRNSQYFVYKIQPRYVSFPLFHHVEYVDTTGKVRLFTDPAISYLKTETHYAAGIPALRDEPWQAGQARGSLVYIWSEFGRPRQVLESSWAFAAADFAKRAGLFDERMPSLPVPGKAGREEVWKKLYFQVRNQASFNGADGIFPSDAGDRARSRPDINMELVRVLRKNGWRAFPALLRPAGEGPLEHDHPSFLQFGSLLACLITERDTLLLDAASETGLPGVIDAGVAGEPALVIRENAFFWLPTAPFAMDRRSLQYRVQLTKDGAAAVTVSGTFQGVAAGRMAGAFRRAGVRDDRGESLVWERGALEGLQWKQVKADTLAARYQAEASFTVRQAAVSFADGLDWFPLPAGLIAEQPFTADWRRFPVVMDRLRHIEAEVELRFPSGYRPPKPVDASFSIDGATIRIETVESRKELFRYRYTIDVSRRFFAPADYAQLQAFFQNWHQISTARWRVPKGQGP